MASDALPATGLASASDPEPEAATVPGAQGARPEVQAPPRPDVPPHAGDSAVPPDGPVGDGPPSGRRVRARR